MSSAVALIIGHNQIYDDGPTNPSFNLDSILYDMAMYHKFFIKRQITIYQRVLTDKFTSSWTVKNKIKGLFQRTEDVCIIAYSGHGCVNSGNWKFSDKTLTFEKIMELWNLYGNNRRLILILGQCYSGVWADKARLIDSDIWVIAASDKEAWSSINGSYFTRWFTDEKTHHLNKLTTSSKVYASSSLITGGAIVTALTGPVGLLLYSVFTTITYVELKYPDPNKYPTKINTFQTLVVCCRNKNELPEALEMNGKSMYFWPRYCELPSFVE